MMKVGRAAGRWAEALGAWAIPPEILARAPEDPYALPVAPFARAAADAGDIVTPSRRVALDALPDGGGVLDVGCGAGAAGLALAPPAAVVVGVDESAAMLERFDAIADERGADHRAILGRWPDVAAGVEPADVVVCHHVLYNVADVELFVRALDEHARRRVVVEITADHPRAWMNPFWEEFWGIERPASPTADGAVALLEEMGLDPRTERWEAPGRMTDHAEVIPMLRRALCLPAEREHEVADALARIGRPAAREVMTLWWPGLQDRVSRRSG